MLRSVARGQAARLAMSGHGSWTARVEAVIGADRLALATVARAPDEPALAGVAAKVTIATPRGLVRAPGVVLATDHTGLVEIAVTDEATVDQRRRHVRVAALLPGLVAPRDEGHAPLHTYTLDVSGGGVLVAGAGPADVGEPVAITVKLPEREPLRADGRIARRTREGHVALSFEGIAEHDREALVAWIFEQQRLERRAAADQR